VSSLQLDHEFTVGLPVPEAWEVLTDLGRLAPCMPGATLLDVEDGRYRGTVKVKVGPMTAQYEGTAEFVDIDEVGRRLVLNAEGRDGRGQGGASAKVTASLESAAAGTVVRVHTDMAMTGKVAQFGRGVLSDVGAKLMEQFATNLERALAVDAAAATGASPAAAVQPPAGDDAVDALKLARSLVPSWFLPAAGVSVLVVALWARHRRNGG
jgi:carbon monoxide dehydrogenase subunit G